MTGVVLVPTGPAPEGGRRVLAVAHGTTGIADQCAPSRRGGGEQLLGAAAIQRGWILAITDYEGLGTPGRHPYLVGESEGRSVIDSVRAAGQLPGARRGPQVLVAGYSQGGHGALWAAQVAPRWAPELEVVATFAGAPATELPLILSAAATRRVVGFAFLLIAGFAAAYPQANPSSVLTDRGLALLESVDRDCVGEVFATLAGEADLVRPEGPTAPPWPELAAANDPGQVATSAPVLIVHSDQDDVVPVALSGLLLERLCRAGQVAERRVLAGGGGHGAAAITAYTDALAWFDSLLAGQAPVNTCS